MSIKTVKTYTNVICKYDPRLSSIDLTSFENRLMILPIGVVSKKRTGAKRIALTSFSWKILAAIHWAQ